MKPTELLTKARSINIRSARQRFAEIMKSRDSWGIQVTGKDRRKVLISYDALIELVDMLEESKDEALREEVQLAREGYQRGGGI